MSNHRRNNAAFKAAQNRQAAEKAAKKAAARQAEIAAAEADRVRTAYEQTYKFYRVHWLRRTDVAHSRLQFSAKFIDSIFDGQDYLASEDSFRRMVDASDVVVQSQLVTIDDCARVVYFFGSSATLAHKMDNFQRRIDDTPLKFKEVYFNQNHTETFNHPWEMRVDAWWSLGDDILWTLDESVAQTLLACIITLEEV